LNLICAASQTSLAATQSNWIPTTTGAASAFWGVSTNWSAGSVPDISTNVNISSGGEAAVAGDSPAVASSVFLGNGSGTQGGLNFDNPLATDLTVPFHLRVGANGGAGTVRVTNYATDRTITLGTETSIGFGPGSLGSYIQDRGTVNASGIVTVGDGSTLDNRLVLEGTGQLSLNNLVIADDANTFVAGRGTVIVRGDARLRSTGLTVAFQFASATGFHGVYEQHGGDAQTGFVDVGDGKSSNGTVVLSDGALATTHARFGGGAGGGTSSVGTLEQDGGVFAIERDLQLGSGPNTGRVNLRGGAISVGRNLIVGGGGACTAIVDQSGGEVTVGGNLIVGLKTSAEGERRYQVSGGTLDVAGQLIMAGIDDNGDVANFDVIGSRAQIHAGGLVLGNRLGRAATLTFKPDSGGVAPIEVDGSVVLDQAGGLQQLVVSLLSPPPKSNLVLIANDGSDSIQGTFDGLPDGSIITAPYGSGAFSWELSYDYDALAGVDGHGNDLALLRIVPEPSGGLLTGLSCLFALARHFLRPGRNPAVLRP
jgi:hypothetical protein